MATGLDKVSSVPLYALGGAIIGGRLGYLKGKKENSLPHMDDFYEKKYQKLDKDFKKHHSLKLYSAIGRAKNRLDNIASGSLLGAVGGTAFGARKTILKVLKDGSWKNEGYNRGSDYYKQKSKEYYKEYRKQRRGYSNGGSRAFNANASEEASEGLKYFKGVRKVKTKKEARTIFKQYARKHHPDLGGTHEEMLKVNKYKEALEKSPWYEKLAFRRGFEKTAGRFQAGLAGLFSSPYAGAYADKGKEVKTSNAAELGAQLGGSVAPILSYLLIRKLLGKNPQVSRNVLNRVDLLSTVPASFAGDIIGGGLGAYIGHGKNRKQKNNKK